MQRLRQWRDFPVALADMFRLGEEIRHFAGIDARLARTARLEQFLALGIESAMQLGYEGERVVSKDFIEARMQLRFDFDASGKGTWHGSNSCRRAQRDCAAF